jgi:hypothetical protein
MAAPRRRRLVWERYPSENDQCAPSARRVEWDRGYPHKPGVSCRPRASMVVRLSARPRSRPISATAARSNTRNQWPRMKARARPSFMTARRTGSRRTRWRRFGCKAVASESDQDPSDHSTSLARSAKISPLSVRWSGDNRPHSLFARS